MLWLHPAFQTVTTILGLYVFVLGLKRFLAVHLGRAAAFNRKRHVLLGKMVVMQWIFGLAGGLSMVRLTWSAVFVTGLHWQIALAMVPLLVVGLATGLSLNKVKRKRRAMALLHAANNSLLLLLALGQCVTGVLVLRDFVLTARP